MRWIFDPSKEGLWVLLLLLILIALIVMWVSPPAVASSSTGLEQEPATSTATEPVVDPRIGQVTHHIRNFLETVCGYDPKKRKQRCLDKVAKTRRWKRAPGLSVLIVQAADEYGVDPMVVSEIARSEASYLEGKQTRVGSRGERGLGQLLPGGRPEKMALAAGLDLTTSLGQVRSIALTYADSLEACGGNVLAALRRYITGSCTSTVSEGPKRRYKRLKKAQKRLAE